MSIPTVQPGDHVTATFAPRPLCDACLAHHPTGSACDPHGRDECSQCGGWGDITPESRCPACKGTGIAS